MAGLSTEFCSPTNYALANFLLSFGTTFLHHKGRHPRKDLIQARCIMKHHIRFIIFIEITVTADTILKLLQIFLPIAVYI